MFMPPLLRIPGRINPVRVHRRAQENDRAERTRPSDFGIGFAQSSVWRRTARFIETRVPSIPSSDGPAVATSGFMQVGRSPAAPRTRSVRPQQKGDGEMTWLKESTVIGGVFSAARR